MTHSQLLATHKRPGDFEPSDCAGKLRVLRRVRTTRLDPAGTGALVPLEVVVFRCPACEARLSTADGTLLNAYQLPVNPTPKRRPLP